MSEPLPLWIGFALSALLIELTPGPNMGFLALVSASRGRRPGWAVTAGIALGLLGSGLLAALGVAKAVQVYPALFDALKYAGALYLVWLAVEQWREADDPWRLDAGANNERTLRRYFRHGLVVNLLNPKAMLFYVTILPQFIAPGADVRSSALGLTGLYVGIATTVHALIVLLGGTLHGGLSRGRTRLVATRAMAVSLVGVAAWIAFDL